MRFLSTDSLALAALLTALVSFGPLSTDMYLPALPGMTADLGSDVAEVQLTLSLFMAGFAVAQLAVGPLSDRHGRRPVLLGGLALYVVASLACLVAPSVEALIAARFVQALGACTGSVLGRAVVRDLHEPDQAARLLSYMGAAMALAPMIAPLLGGFMVVWWGWRSVFGVLVLFGAALFALVARRLPETNAHPDPLAMRPVRMLANYATLLRHRIYLGHLLTVAATFGGLFAFISGSSFVLIGDFGLEPQAFGLAFGVVVAAYAAGSFASGRLVRRFGGGRLIPAGCLAQVAGAAAMLVLAEMGIAHPAAVVAPMMVYMVGAGLTLPNALAGAIGPFPRMAGAAAALVGFVQMATASLTGVAVGHLHNGTALPMAGTIAAMGIGALAAHWALPKRLLKGGSA
jgi:DHA1 family bicyclomycin/chloramphenicol resistance-like MFS transporter